MKKLVTSLAFVVSLCMTQSVNAQVSIIEDRTIENRAPQPAPAVPFIPTAADGKNAPLFTPTETLSYFDRDQTGERYLWEMPRRISIRFEESDDTIVGFSQRFTSSIKPRRYLDSVIIAYRAFSMNPASRILVAVRRSSPKNANDRYFYDWTNLIDSVSFGIDDIVVNEDEEDPSYNYIALPMRHKSLPTTSGTGGLAEFFVTVHLWDSRLLPNTDVTETRFALVSDLYVESQSRELDNDIDRSYFLTRNLEDPSPDSVSARTFQVFLGGYFVNTSTDEVFYPNFEMYAVVTGVADVANGDANAFSLKQNYPNPFNPATEIEYTLEERSPVTLEVFNTLGDKVATLVNEVVSAGTHTATFDAANLTSGTYYYTLNAGGETLTKHMILAK